MPLSHALQFSACCTEPESFSRIHERLDPGWIEEALEASGVATLRRRRLPAEQVVWLVLGIAFVRNKAIQDVVDSLDVALPSPRGALAKSAIPPARMRLGAAPMRWLFERSGRTWAHASADRLRWRGFALYAIDGTKFRTADSVDNRAHFGVWTTHKGASSNPLVRVVTLMALSSHLLAAARIGPYAETSEMQFATTLVDEIPARSVTILDALYLSAAMLLKIERPDDQRHWMTRAKSSTKMREIERYGANDCLVEMTVSSEARALDPTLPKTWRARAVTYNKAGFKPRTLLTSLRDPKKFPAEDLIELYHQRWEIELGYGELKTDVLDAEPTLRSKSPELVEQEIWGTLIVFNLVRLEMERIAAEAKVPPTRISFVLALHLIRDEWAWSSITRSPGAIPKHLASLRANIKRLVLPPRRSTRSYPRTLKNDYRAYPRRKREPSAK
jgi:hypothetical protein